MRVRMYSNVDLSPTWNYFNKKEKEAYHQVSFASSPHYQKIVQVCEAIVRSSHPNTP